MRRHPFRVAATAFALIITLGGCAAEPDAERTPGSIPLLDASEYDGLTPEQLQAQAQPMTLEEAELLGIVDTTIHIEYPINPDSAL
ncbi:MAG: hypothetical protein LBG44_06740 [Gemmatimonadota bacterium]|nr:hypothetical protein [Gemmatimonadota bacterium]